MLGTPRSGHRRVATLMHGEGALPQQPLRCSRRLRGDHKRPSAADRHNQVLRHPDAVATLARAVARLLRHGPMRSRSPRNVGQPAHRPPAQTRSARGSVSAAFVGALPATVGDLGFPVAGGASASVTVPPRRWYTDDVVVARGALPVSMSPLTASPPPRRLVRPVGPLDAGSWAHWISSLSPLDVVPARWTSRTEEAHIHRKVQTWGTPPERTGRNPPIGGVGDAEV